MIRHAVFAAIFVLPLSAAPALATAATGTNCATMTDAYAKERFARWNASLASGTADAVTLWYTPDAKVHLAVKEKPSTDQQALRSFYEGAMLKGIKADLKDRKLSATGCNTATDNGRVVYRIGDRSVEATYKKVYENRGGVWLIKEHSSTKVQ